MSNTWDDLAKAEDEYADACFYAFSEYANRTREDLRNVRDRRAGFKRTRRRNGSVVDGDDRDLYDTGTLYDSFSLTRDSDTEATLSYSAPHAVILQQRTDWTGEMVDEDRFNDDVIEYLTT